MGRKGLETVNNRLNDFFDQYCTVKWDRNKRVLNIIDQTLLPNEIRRMDLTTREDVWCAIKELKVRGAPAIGITAAYGAAMLSDRLETEDFSEFYQGFLREKNYLASSRPTAVNLFWALDRMEGIVWQNKDKCIGEIKARLFEEAAAILREDSEINRKIGEYGYELLKRVKKAGSVGILTHCNAGTLACSKYGTATAPMYVAIENGWNQADMHVYCDETRPLLQGARLTSFELSRAGIPTSVQCDDMAAHLMKSGKVDIVFVGCDRVAANGDVANKIGTSALAIMARYYKIPFYVCSPISTIDTNTLTGEDIPIEFRSDDEIKSKWYAKQMVPEGVDTSNNPAFDVTDHGLITGIITEKGILREPFTETIKDMLASGSY